MKAHHVDAFVRALTIASPRRGLLAVLGTGFLLPHVLGLGTDETRAKRHNKRHRKRKRQAKRKRRQGRHQRPAAAAAPVTRVDATCVASNPGTLTAIEENSRLAQAFTALASGPLVRADLRIAKAVGAGGDFVLRLSPVQQFGTTFPPTNDILAETSIAEASLPVGESTASFLFANPFPVVAGTTYALVLNRPGGGRFGWVNSGDDLCPGGSFFSSNQTGAFVDTSGDYFFTTFVAS